MSTRPGLTAERAGVPPLRAVPVKDVVLQGGFWAPKLAVIRDRTIPHSWPYMAGEIRALQKAAGRPVEGELNGTWGEANLFKFLETVAYSLAQQPDPDLEHRVDEVVALVAAAQQPDGYAHAYVVNEKKTPWDPTFLDGSHDGYVLGHMIQAAIAYHAATGKRAFLEVASRAADQAGRHFLGPNGHPGFCGHAELEMALVELSRVTGKRRYLELAQAFVEWRGRGLVKPAGPTPRAYFQDAVPVREQRTLEGHAVRALFFATGVTELANATGEIDYRLAANRYWDSTTLRRMAITGGVGPREEHEAFGEDYELPNEGYYESCAACGLADFAQQMFLLERRSESADVLERVLYNAAPHGLELTGTNSYYQNPLSDHDRPRYNSWVCCPPNLSRTLLRIGNYAYAADRDVWVNLYVSGRARVARPGGDVTLEVTTDYPWDGAVKIIVHPANARKFALRLRQPGWCESLSIRLNGSPLDPANRRDRGYVALDREWRAGDTVELRLDMPVRRMLAHPNIASCRGKVALQRGPVVYGFEGLDNGGPAVPVLGAQSTFSLRPRPDLLGGVTVLEGTDEAGKPLLALPFYTLGNRAKSTQEVWVNQRGLQPDSSWWAGRLYRPLSEATLTPD